MVFSDNYQPFGQENGTPTGSETYKFTGKPVSQTTGLYYDYRRWYDPTTGRFISQDPIKGHRSNPETLNPYLYVTNTPTSETDPTGLDGGFGADNRCEKLHQCSSAGPDPLFTSVSNWWSGLPDWVKVAIIVGVVVIAIVATAGIAAPELLPAMIPLLVGDTSFLGAALGLGEDAAASLPSFGNSGNSSNSASTAATDALSKGATDDLVDTSLFWKTTESGGYDLESTQIHHLLPRQFQSFFQSAKRSLNIDDYTVQLDRGVHMTLHGRGGSYFESWNGQWQGFVWNNRGADQSDVLEFLGTLLDDFGF